MLCDDSFYRNPDRGSCVMSGSCVMNRFITSVYRITMDRTGRGKGRTLLHMAKQNGSTCWWGGTVGQKGRKAHGKTRREKIRHNVTRRAARRRDKVGVSRLEHCNTQNTIQNENKLARTKLPANKRKLERKSGLPGTLYCKPVWPFRYALL